MLVKKYFQLFLMKLCILKNFAEEVNLAFAGDFHGIYNVYPLENGESVGGVARMKSALTNDSLFIYVGDILKAHSTMDKARVASQILTSLKPDAIILGMNEFMVNQEQLEWFKQQTSNIVTAVNLEHTTKKTLPQNKILRNGGVAMVIFGYISEDVEMYPATKNYIVRNIIQELHQKTALVKAASKEVQLVIAAGCTGIESAKKIAESSEHIDIILSSCSPNLLWSGKENIPEDMVKYGDYPIIMKNKRDRKVIVAHNFGSTKFLAKLKITLDQGTITAYNGEVVYMNSSLPLDSKTAAIVAEEKNPPVIRTGVLGEARVYLDGACRKSECNFGNMVADAFVQYKSNMYTKKYWTDTPIALVAAGNIRGSVNATAYQGKITADELCTALPNTYNLVTLEIKGSDLRQVLEDSLNVQKKYGGDKYLQVSGVRLVYDSRRSAGSKILSVKIRCATCSVPSYSKLNSEEVYMLVTTENLVKGDFGHKTLAEKATNVVVENKTNWQAVLDYIKQNRMLGTPNSDRITQMQMRISDGSRLIAARTTTLGVFILHWLVSVVSNEPP